MHPIRGLTAACCQLWGLQAVEASQFAKPTQFVMLQNYVPKSVSNVFFRVEAWGGGLERGTGGKVVSGMFT